MKASRYNFFFKEDGLLFNAVSCALAQVLPENVDLIEKVLENPCENNLSALDTDIKEKLIEGGFLIEDDVDELAFLEARYNLARFSPNFMGLTIAPTLDCNFDCIYCYEEKKKGYMSNTVINKIVGLVAQMVNLRILKVTWYGGEPLLYPEIILELSQKLITLCDERKIDYIAGLVTNGYLLSYDLAKTLRDLARVQWVQVTLDGPPKVHNSRRRLQNGEGTFDKILENVVKSANLFQVGIRINIDKTNYNQIEPLFPILFKSGINQKVLVGLGCTWSTTPACKDIAEDCLEMHAFSKIEFQIKQKLEKYGFVVRPFVPQPLAAPCGAVYPFSYLIAPDGKLYKCWETIGMENESVGEIDHMGVLTPTLMKWINYDPFHQINSKGCQNCQFMPICLGGCPYLYFVWESSQQPKSECSRWKYTLREAMLWIAQRVKQNPDILQALNFKSGRG